MEEKKEWVDFKLIKSEVTIQMVLDHYGITGLRQVGQELRGKCPIHRGDNKSKHLSVNLNKNAFKCFSTQCGAHGNILDFVAAMERCSIRDAALKLNDWFKVGDSQSDSPEQGEETENVAEVQRGIYRDNEGALYELIAPAASAEDVEPLVVYRELFGDYQYWVCPLQNFSSVEERGQTSFTLVKAL